MSYTRLVGPGGIEPPTSAGFPAALSLSYGPVSGRLAKERQATDVAPQCLLSPGHEPDRHELPRVGSVHLDNLNVSDAGELQTLRHRAERRLVWRREQHGVRAFREVPRAAFAGGVYGLNCLDGSREVSANNDIMRQVFGLGGELGRFRVVVVGRACGYLVARLIACQALSRRRLITSA